jgi:hypothetical protein
MQSEQMLREVPDSILSRRGSQAPAIVGIPMRLGEKKRTTTYGRGGQVLKHNIPLNTYLARAGEKSPGLEGQTQPEWTGNGATHTRMLELAHRSELQFRDKDEGTE